MVREELEDQQAIEQWLSKEAGRKVEIKSPKKGEKITNKDTVYLITNDSKYTVPNVVGLSSKEANALLFFVF